jgi:hypothetical protein
LTYPPGIDASARLPILPHNIGILGSEALNLIFQLSPLSMQPRGRGTDKGIGCLPNQQRHQRVASRLRQKKEEQERKEKEKEKEKERK